MHFPKSPLSAAAIAATFVKSEKQDYSMEHAKNKRSLGDQMGLLLLRGLLREQQLDRLPASAFSSRSIRKRSSRVLNLYGPSVVYFTVSSKWHRYIKRRFLGHMKWFLP